MPMLPEDWPSGRLRRVRRGSFPLVTHIGLMYAERTGDPCTPLVSLTHHGSGGMTTAVSSRDGREDKADAADDEIRWHFVRPESEQLHWVVELDRTKDESIVFKFREP